jgi:hypothetical protein
LPSNDRGIHTHTHADGRDFFNYAVEMGSRAVIYVPSLIKIGSGIQKLMGAIHTHRQQHDLIRKADISDMQQKG